MNYQFFALCLRKTFLDLKLVENEIQNQNQKLIPYLSLDRVELVLYLLNIESIICEAFLLVLSSAGVSVRVEFSAKTLITIRIIIRK